MKEKKKLITSIVFSVLVIVAIIVCIMINQPEKPKTIETTAVSVTQQAVIAPPVETPVPEVDPTEGVYTFLQGPKSWKEKRPWSGVWGKTMLEGGSFGGFGCGLCCMANIYSTITPYECSPLDMYEFAKEKTEYWSGAIEWAYLKEGMEELGFLCSLGKKPKNYEDFRSQIESSQAAILLISSAEDSSYWQDTPGHYITSFLYQKENDTIFLGDSGNPDHNRQWVSLRTIYKALKTSSRYQFMTVSAYQDEKNKWRKNGIKDKWAGKEVKS